MNGGPKNLNIPPEPSRFDMSVTLSSSSISTEINFLIWVRESGSKDFCVETLRETFHHFFLDLLCLTLFTFLTSFTFFIPSIQK